MNELQLHAEARTWPDEIIVEPSRLASGIWGEPEGDIAAAYSADIFPKIRTFIHDRQVFTNTGTAMGTSNNEEGFDGYPLIPEAEYTGPEPKRYTYEGRSVLYRGRSCRLGPRVKFVSHTRTVEEWIDLLRRQYAHGGYFASGKNYRQVLLYFKEGRQSVLNYQKAIEAELATENQPNTQTEMLARLGKARTALLPAKQGNQLELEI